MLNVEVDGAAEVELGAGRRESWMDLLEFGAEGTGDVAEVDRCICLENLQMMI
jgi:hypothetical protein